MPMPTKLLEGKKGLVLGLANDRSIAWGIAKAAHDHGAQLAFTYQGDALLKRIKPLIDTLGDGTLLMPCDVTRDADMDATFQTLKDTWGSLDFVVHSVAFSDKEQLKGHYKDTTRENFLQTMDISVFSFTDVAKRASALMNDGGSMITLTYYGAERVMPHYNVMGVAKAALEASVRYLAADLGARGIRVNAISAGPIKTLAAMGIGDFRYILKWNEFNSPLQRNVSIEDVGGSGLYLLSDLSRGVTGEVHHVDSGYHTVGMLNMESVSEVADLLDSIRKG
ncbi:enoyl-ACP reductase FabI [Pararhodospirillum photometricum]|nr:enoyl-ACP reductase FabI [Pararhodospirillum photometricum]